MSHAIEFLSRLSAALNTQDNEYTASPIYCIEEHVLVTGLALEYAPNVGWMHSEDGLADEQTTRDLDRHYRHFGSEPEEWTRTGYEWDWRYTGQFYLTRAAANAFVGNNKKYRVYIDTACRNHELKQVRRLLAGPLLRCVKLLQEIGESIEIDAVKSALTNLDTAKEPHA